MMSTKKRTVLGSTVSAIAALAMVGCGVTNQSGGTSNGGDAPFYEGKTITVIVPFDAGGASDTYSRLLGGYLSQYVEGEPEVVIENVPGGGQKEGLNRFERADHEEGVTLAMASGGILASTLIDPEGVQFDPGGYETLASFGGGMTIYGSTAAGIGSLDDVVESEQPVFYGGLELNASEAVRVFALDQLGIADFQPLMGYDGGGSVTAAVLRGELTIGNSTSSHYLANVLPLEEDGEVTPLLVQGFVEDGEVVRDEALPDLPTMPEAYETLTGEQADGMGWDVYRAITTAQTNLLRNYWIHSTAPDEAKAALHDGMAQAVEDEEFLAEAKELLGEEPMVQLADEADRSLTAARDLSDEQVEWLQGYIDEVTKQ